MTFALVNEKMELRVFLCGTVDLQFSEGLAISPVIFNAQTFAARADAEEVLAALKDGWGEDWKITEIIGVGSS